MIGISKGYTTANTAFTSNPENYSITQGNLTSVNPHAKNMFQNTQTDILNYPYAYDQDLKTEVDFQEKLYRQSAEQKAYLADQQRNI